MKATSKPALSTAKGPKSLQMEICTRDSIARGNPTDMENIIGPMAVISREVSGTD